MREIGKLEMPAKAWIELEMGVVGEGFGMSVDFKGGSFFCYVHGFRRLSILVCPWSLGFLFGVSSVFGAPL
jgi:hypothetical protein